MNGETKKLYYQNAYQKTFSAHVLECTPEGEVFRVVLDRTAFYPEGGGQPADTGVLGFANVLDVHEKDGVIFHTVDRALPAGNTVMGGINWARRFAHMQQHTGEHIVSGIAHRFFGLDNVGFRMGSSVITVDWNGELSAEQLSTIEMLANDAVYRDLAVAAEFPEPERLKQIEYRSKKELTGAVRIVTIPGADVCACCGTHVARTGEIGPIKIIASQRYKGGTRVTLVCGAQAMADYSERLTGIAKVSVLLSAKPEEVAQSVERMLRENAELKRELTALQTERMEREAREMPQGSVCCFFADLSPDLLRRTALLFSEQCGGTASVLSGSEEEGYKYALADETGDVRPLAKELNAAFSGRGGGPKELCQGSLAGSREALKTFFAERGFSAG